MNIIPIASGTGCCRPAAQTPQRLRLPVAPRALARVRWAADGKPTPAMTPDEALTWLDSMHRQGVEIAAVELAGPGDPLAAPGSTLETLALVHRRYPDIALSITTLGLGVEPYAGQLADLGVRQVTVLVDAVEPEAAARVYAWVRPGTKTLPVSQAVALLLGEQARTVAAMKRAGMTVHIQTTVCPGVNDGQVEAIARQMAALGADTMTLLPAHRPADAPQGNEAEDEAVLATVRTLAARHLPVVEAQATAEPGGADAALGGAFSLPKPTPERPNVAVVSVGGMEVDLHLGHAIKALVYGPREDGLISLLATRELPEPGGGSARWEEVARILNDCFALLTVSAGESPRQILADRGVRVLITEGEIDGAVDLLYGGGKKKAVGR